MHYQSQIKLSLICALAALTCQPSIAFLQAAGAPNATILQDTIPVDKSLQDYYIHYVYEMEKKGDDIACHLQGMAQGEVGMEKMQEWLRGLETDEERLQRFYTTLYLVYWRYAERRQQVLSFLENDSLRLSGVLTLGAPQLLIMMRYNALSSDFEQLTSFLLKTETTIRIHT